MIEYEHIRKIIDCERYAGRLYPEWVRVLDMAGVPIHDRVAVTILLAQCVNLDAHPPEQLVN